jgi:rhodanese-related sulfurtransferase
VEHVEQFQRYLAARPLPSAKCYVDPALSRSDFTTPEEVNEVYRRRARFYDWSVNTYYLIGFRWWAYRRRAIAALQLGRCDRRGDWLRHRAQLRTGTGADRPDRTSAWRRSLRRYAGTGAQRVAARGWDNVELIRARATDFDFPARVEAAFSTFALSLEPRFDEVIAKIAATLVPGGRFVLLDLRMPDNWLRHLAPALIGLVRPFAVSLEVAKRQPWESLQHRFPQYSYQKGYLGIVYIAIGQS